MHRIVTKVCLVVAAGAAAISPAALAAGGDPDDSVDVYVGSVSSTTRVELFKDMTITVVANTCALHANELTLQLQSSRRVRCPGHTSGDKDAWVEDSSSGDDLFDVYVGDIESDIGVALLEDVSVPAAAAACAVAPDILKVQLRSRGRARCVGKTTGVQRAWVEPRRR
jgi:hypothetical protein